MTKITYLRMSLFSDDERTDFSRIVSFEAKFHCRTKEDKMGKRIQREKPEEEIKKGRRRKSINKAQRPMMRPWAKQRYR